LVTKSELSQKVYRELNYAFNPDTWFTDVFREPFHWQHQLLTCRSDTLLLCARQSGKSQGTGGLVAHKAKYIAKSLQIVIAPSQTQSKETMLKIADCMAEDPDYPRITGSDSVFEKGLANKSRVVGLPGSERSVRGYSGPLTLFFDEASRVQDATYFAATPMQVDTPGAVIVAATTPFGKRGWFYKAWTEEPWWTKILVKPRYTLDKDDNLIEDMPEEEFHAMWLEKGIHAYYSPRHDYEFLYKKLQSEGPYSFRQEYLCEFMEPEDAFFRYDDIIDARSDNLDLWDESLTPDEDIPPWESLEDIMREVM
jgi:hypothetical protein